MQYLYAKTGSGNLRFKGKHCLGLDIFILTLKEIRNL